LSLTEVAAVMGSLWDGTSESMTHDTEDGFFEAFEEAGVMVSDF